MSSTGKKLIVANWKMHNTVQQASHFVLRLLKTLEHVPREAEVVLCPSFVSLQPLVAQLRNTQIRLGAQNLHHLDEGTFTGEISGLMLKGIADYVIIGHSERRNYAHETDDIIAKKVAACVRHHITPIICIGENLVDRQEGATRHVVHSQLVAALSLLTPEDLLQRVVLTYEPVWAISSGDGHGHDDPPEDVSAIIKYIRHNVAELYGQKALGNIRVLYGGSVNPSNARGYIQAEGVDGFLVGGASLNYQQFADIIKATKE